MTPCYFGDCAHEVDSAAEISTADAAAFRSGQGLQFRILDARFPQTRDAECQAGLDVARTSLVMADVKNDFLTVANHVRRHFLRGITAPLDVD